VGALAGHLSHPAYLPRNTLGERPSRTWGVNDVRTKPRHVLRVVAIAWVSAIRVIGTRGPTGTRGAVLLFTLSFGRSHAYQKAVSLVLAEFADFKSAILMFLRDEVP
jgi:hypothetical protein